MKPTLYYLYETGTFAPRLADWPELGTIELVEAGDHYIQNFCMGYRDDISDRVYTMQRGSDYGLKTLRHITEGGRVVALYGESLQPTPEMDLSWHRKLEGLASLRGFIVCDFNRHDVCAALGRKAFWDGIELLQQAAEVIRGPAIMASPDAMKTETALTRAIESLCKQGYKTPRT